MPAMDLQLLSEKNLREDPFEQFGVWFDDAKRWAGMDYPEAAVLSTVSPEGRPEGRVILAKSFDPRGFVFYTNMLSPKGLALKARPEAALTFYWPTLMRQVRAAGPVQPVADDEADDYWRTRPRGSQLGAAVSEQSGPLESRAVLEGRIRELEARLAGAPVPRPRHWSGTRLAPRTMEFWQDGRDRLHDRFLFTRRDGGWDAARLFP